MHQYELTDPVFPAPSRSSFAVTWNARISQLQFTQPAIHPQNVHGLYKPLFQMKFESSLFTTFS